jgi:hypothetical protein
MPMIDVYATEGTFADPASLPQRLAATLMRIEEVPELPMFRHNTAGFVHPLAEGSIANVEGESDYVRWGLWGHAHTNAELVSAARAEAAKLSGGSEDD